MIELITGSPGAGKTTFAVAMRIALESLRKITGEDGAQVQRRIVTAGFRGLVVEHEKLPHKLTGESTATSEVNKWNAVDEQREGAPVHERLPGDPPADVSPIVENWWLWCMPGDLICIDEAQFVAPRGTLGRKPPVWIQKLEVHRHYGVDFLMVTQHPQLIDTTIRALVGLHRHVRAVMGSPVCMVYTWDHASNPERYNMANKGTFVRRAKHYRLFHSSVAHVKPPSSGRWALVAVPLLAAIGFLGLGHKINGWISPANAKGGAQVAQAGQGAQVGQQAGQGAQSTLARPAGFMDVPELAGCWAQGDACQCIGRDGRRVRVQLSMCQLSSRSYDGLVAWQPRPVVKGEGYGAAAPVGAAASGARAALF